MLERDPVKTAEDVENGFLTQEAARSVYGIVVVEGDEGRWHADLEATEALRKKMLAERLSRARPVAEWMADESKRVAARDFAPEVCSMYKEAMRLSPRFRAEFTAFWNLPEDFEMEGGK